MLAPPAARPRASRCFLAITRSAGKKRQMDCRSGLGFARRGLSTHTAASPPGEEDEVEAAARGKWRGEGVSLKEWQGWGTSSPVPATVTKVVDDLMELERETEAEMTFGGLGGKLQGSFKVQEDKKHREVYQSLTDSEMKLQFFAARQIACRLLGSRGYLCQKVLIAGFQWKIVCVPSYCHVLCGMGYVFGCTCIQRISFDKITLESCYGKGLVWFLYPNKSKTTMSAKDISLQHPLAGPKPQLYQEPDQKPLNFVLIDGTWSNSAAMYKRLKEHARQLWGEDDLPCVSLSTLGASAMHKLRPQPAWDRTCTAAAAIGLLSELHLRSELSSYRLDKQAEALETALDVLLDALTKRRLRMGRSITRKERSNLV